MLFLQQSHNHSAQFAFSPLLSFLFTEKALLSSLLNKSADWSFGKEYYCYATDIISLSPFALIYVAYAQGSFAMHLAATSPRWRTGFVISMLTPIKYFHMQIKEHRKIESGDKENTLVGLLFNYTSAFLSYSKILKISTVGGDWVLKAP